MQRLRRGSEKIRIWSRAPTLAKKRLRKPAATHPRGPAPSENAPCSVVPQPVGMDRKQNIIYRGKHDTATMQSHSCYNSARLTPHSWSPQRGWRAQGATAWPAGQHSHDAGHRLVEWDICGSTNTSVISLTRGVLPSQRSVWCCKVVYSHYQTRSLS